MGRTGGHYSRFSRRRRRASQHSFLLRLLLTAFCLGAILGLGILVAPNEEEGAVPSTIIHGAPTDPGYGFDNVEPIVPDHWLPQDERTTYRYDQNGYQTIRSHAPTSSSQ